MTAYVVKRALLLVPTLLIVSLTIFSILRVLPGDVAVVILSAGGESGSIREADLQNIRESLGLDKPLYEQYVTWMASVVRLDFGDSLWTKRPIIKELAERLPLTLELGVLATVFSTVVGVLLGAISATNHEKPIDLLARFLAIIAHVVPNFYLASLVILFLALVVRWLPPLEFRYITEDPWANAQKLVFPVIVVSMASLGGVARMTRSALLEVLREDYIRTAQAKGLTDRRVLWRHAMKNAMLPVLTVIGSRLGGLISGAVIIESIFALPGVGWYLVQAINGRDYPVVQAIVLLLAATYAGFNLVVDIMYAYLDPRIRYS